MKIDTIALYVAIVAVALYVLFWLFMAASLGAVGWLLLIPLAIGAYFFAVVVQQRLNNKEDDHYDKVEK